VNSDGVSLPTQIVQLGTVAKTQSRAQQQAQATTPFKDQLERREELHVQRVNQTEAADHRRIEAEQEEPDKRRRRRLRREQKAAERAADDDGPDRDGDGPGTDDDAEKLGSLIDLRA